MSAGAEKTVTLHEWETEDGEIDIFAFEYGNYHNGPRCRRCGEGFCHHCEPGRYSEPCPGASVPLPASLTTIPVSCPCGATVHADTYPDGVTHTTVCECGRRVHVNVEVGS